MNILFLTISGLYDIATRGIYSDLMREFVRNGHNVYVMCPFERRMARSTEMFESHGAKIVGVRTLNIQKTNIVEKGVATLLLERQFMNALRCHLDDVPFDAVLYSTPPITFNKVISYVKNRYGAKSYLLLKDIFPQNAVDLGMMSRSGVLYKMFRRKEQELYRISDWIGCMSPANVEYVLRHNPSVESERVHVNPNSIEPQHLPTIYVDAVRRKYALPQDRPIFIYGGNLGRPQGVDFLLRVLDHYLGDNRLFFVVVGSGTEYPKIERWFAERRPANARLMERLPKEEYDRLVQACDVGMIFLDARFTIPNYPSRLLSYLQYRMPVIAATDPNTDLGTIAEEGGYGLWAQSGDMSAFAAHVERLLDARLRCEMGENGYRHLLSNYTIDKSYRIIIKHIAQDV